jgi:hypothetical protein
MSSELVEREKGVENYLRELPGLEFPACLDRKAYLVVPGKQRLIAVEQAYNGFQFWQARGRVVCQGLQMSSISAFLAHYCNVRDAALGNTELYDGVGKAWKKTEAEAFWERLSTNCWTWLDAVFHQGKEELEMESDFRIRRFEQDGGSVEQRSSRRTSLDLPVPERGYVSLLFNAQGMPLQRAEQQSYVRGANIFFYPPISGHATMFCTNSDGTFLVCEMDPSRLNPRLGVIASAEGTSVREKTPRQSNEYDILIGAPVDEQYIGLSSLVRILGEIEQSGKLTPGVRELILRRAVEEKD